MAIVDTPIRLELKDNLISFDEKNTLEELMENNIYKVEIYTNEDLEGCQLAMKRYGDGPDELIIINENLSFETERLIIVKTTIDGEEKKLWGVLKKDASSTSGIYKAILKDYEKISQITEVPELEKIIAIEAEEVGEITGTLTKSGEEVSFSNYILTYNNETITISEGTVITLYRDMTNIPDPPTIQTTLRVPERIRFSNTIEYSEKIGEYNFLISLIFEDYEVSNPVYSQIDESYSYSDMIEFNQYSSNHPTEEEASTNTVVYDIIKKEYSDGTEGYLKIQFKIDGLEITKTELESLINDFNGDLNIKLKFNEKDFSDYEFQVNGNLNLKTNGQVQKTNDNGESLYRIPKKVISEIVPLYKLQTDGTGEPLKEEIFLPLYEKDSSDTAIVENGRYIPVYKYIDESGEKKIEVDENGYAKRTYEMTEREVNKIKYQKNSMGEILYEYLLIPKYKRNANGKIELTDGKPEYIYDDNGKVVYEKTENGEYIYDKQPMPIYIYDENNEIEKDENGLFEVEYETDGTGEPKLDENGNYIFTEEIEEYVVTGWESSEDYEENPVTYNLLPKYIKKDYYGIKYFELDTKTGTEVVGTEIKLIIETDEEENTIFDIDSNGNFIPYPGIQNVMIDGIITTESLIEQTSNNITNINYTGFSYNEEKVDKAQFSPEALEENDIYTVILGNSDGTTVYSCLNLHLEKILLGLIKKENITGGSEQKVTTYATNAVELPVARSIETITWQAEEAHLNEKYVIANYDGNTNKFYEVMITNGNLSNGMAISGKENYVYFDYYQIYNNANITINTKDLAYKWNPEIGFYKIGNVKG